MHGDHALRIACSNGKYIICIISGYFAHSFFHRTVRPKMQLQWNSCRNGLSILSRITYEGHILVWWQLPSFAYHFRMMKLPMYLCVRWEPNLLDCKNKSPQFTWSSNVMLPYNRRTSIFIIQAHADHSYAHWSTPGARYSQVKYLYCRAKLSTQTTSGTFLLSSKKK
jgi:hypothetical protein